MSTSKPATLNISILFVLVGPTMCLPTPPLRVPQIFHIVSLKPFAYVHICGNINHPNFVGASTVKWTALDSCSGLSVSDPKLYTNFDLYKIKIHKHLESM